MSTYRPGLSRSNAPLGWPSFGAPPHTLLALLGVAARPRLWLSVFGDIFSYARVGVPQ